MIEEGPRRAIRLANAKYAMQCVFRGENCSFHLSNISFKGRMLDGSNDLSVARCVAVRLFLRANIDRAVQLNALISDYALCGARSP